MVVPEKILMKKIKKREKVKKQLIASKQAKISTENESTENFDSELKMISTYIFDNLKK